MKCRISRSDRRDKISTMMHRGYGQLFCNPAKDLNLGGARAGAVGRPGPRKITSAVLLSAI